MAAVGRITLQSNGTHCCCIFYRSFILNVSCLTNKCEHQLSSCSYWLTYFAHVHLILVVCGRFVVVPPFQKRQTAKPDPLWKINNTRRKKIQTPNNLCLDSCLPIHFCFVCILCWPERHKSGGCTWLSDKCRHSGLGGWG